MRPKVAERRIKSFEKRFGKPHLYLAYHAAFPLALTPDLLYRLWANFQRDIDGQPLNIPWVAVADLLLSGLCEEVGQELYEMDEAIRNELLKQLRAADNFSQTRIIELSDFLLNYVRQQLLSNDPDIQDFAHAQRWTALAYTKPTEAAHQLASTFHQLGLDHPTNQVDKSELMRMASLVETLADPLVDAQLEPLLVYAQGMASLAHGNLEEATTQLNQIAEAGKIQIAGVDLPIPSSIKDNLEEPDPPKAADYSHQKLRGRSFRDQDLTRANFSHTDIGSADFTNTTLIGANFSHATMGLQRRWASLIVFSSLILLLLSGIGSALLGLLLGASLFPLESRITLSLNNIFIFTGFASVVVFAMFYLANLNRSRKTIAKSLTGVWLSAPALVFMSILWDVFGGQFYLSADIIEQFSIMAGGVSSLLFPLPYLITFRKGLRPIWVAGALGLIGAAYYAGGVLFSVNIIYNSVSDIDPLVLTWLTVTVVISLVFAGAIIIVKKADKSTIIKALIASVTFILIFSGSMILTGDLYGIDAALPTAFAGLCFVVAVVLAGIGTQKILARMLVMVSTFSVFITGIVVVVFWLENPASSEDLRAFLLGIAIVAGLSLLGAIVITVPLILAGASAFAGAVIGIGVVAVLIAILFAWVWASEQEIISDGLVGIIASVEVSVAGIALAWAIVVTVAIAVALVWAEAERLWIALGWSGAIAGIAMAITVIIFLMWDAPVFIIAEGIVTGIAIIGLGIYIGWQALMDNPKFAFIRQFAISIAARGGTSFRGANLTNANFAQANIKSSNFQQANLTRTDWFKSKKLNHAFVEDSYLQYPQVQQLAVTKVAQGQTFNHLNVSGINLRGANLADASFIGSNLNKSDLQGADLSRAKLRQTKLEQANLTGARLTGAYIPGWKLTSATQLKRVECDYIFTRLPTKDNPEPGRQPSDYRKMFKPGELAKWLDENSA